MRVRLLVSLPIVLFACSPQHAVERDAPVDVAEALSKRFVARGSDGPVRIVPSSATTGFDRIDGVLAPRGVPNVRYSPTAAGGFVVSAGDLSLSVGLFAVSASQASVSTSGVTYANALAGIDWIHVPLADGTEEAFLLRARPATHTLLHWVEPRGAAFLRQIDDVLEVLDATGTPRLRTTAPVVIDAEGRVRHGYLRVVDCAVDRSPALPWGRPVTPMGHDRCAIETGWDDAGLTYPLLVDPAWTQTTSSLAIARSRHTSVVLDSGKVVVIGGFDGTDALSSVEVYDPTTATWAVGPSLPWAAQRPAAVAFGSLVVVAGGATGAPENVGTDKSATIDFSVTTPAWTARAAMPGGPRAKIAAAPIRNSTTTNAALFVGGRNSAAFSTAVDRFDFSTMKWNGEPGAPGKVTQLTIGRAAAGIWSSNDLRVVVFGGQISGDVTGEVLEYKGGVWGGGVATLTTPRFDAAVVEVNGWIVIAGGTVKGGGPTDMTEMYNATSLARKDGPPLTADGTRSARFDLTGAAAGKRVIFAGGADGWAPYSSRAVDVFDVGAGPTGSVVGLTSKMNLLRARATAAPLPSGAIMVIAGDYNDGTGIRFRKGCEIYGALALAAACALDGDCASAHCVDAVCCDTACTGQCQACNTKSAAGTCTTVTMTNGPTGYPAGQAITGYGTTTRTGCVGHGTTCGSYCSGTSATACSFGATTKECVAPSCTGGKETQSAKCNGSGACNAAVTKGCAEYACGATACKFACSVLSDCATGYKCDTPTSKCVPNGTKGSPCGTTSPCATGLTCVDGACCTTSSCAAPTTCNNPEDPGVCKLPKGTTCTVATDCASGFCVDNRCCDKACGGQCEACDVGGAVGTCTAVDGAPHGSRTACGGTGACKSQCNGSTRDACGTPPGSGVVCASPTCKDGTASLVTTCIGTGICPTPDTLACAPYVCNTDGTACATSCATDAQCASGHVCKLGKCEVKLGTACTKASDCLSGSCADSFCRDAPCAGFFGACNVPGAEGTCQPKAGEPAAGHGTCDDGAGDPCRALSCDGKTPSKCLGFMNGPEKLCRSACDGTGAVVTSYCNGAGSCAPNAPVTCGSYVCEGDACRTTCTVDTHCAKGFICADGKCSPPAPKCTADGKASIPPTGDAVPCLGYRCNPSSGECRTTCVATEDCDSGFVCDTGKCVAVTHGGDTEDGGGCAAARSNAKAPRAMLFALVALALATRRRRRAPSSPSWSGRSDR